MFKPLPLFLGLRYSRSRRRNGFIAFIASMLLEKYPGTTIVTDSVTSTGLTEYI